MRENRNRLKFRNEEFFCPVAWTTYVLSVIDGKRREYNSKDICPLNGECETSHCKLSHSRWGKKPEWMP